MGASQKSPWFVHPALLAVALLYGGSYSIAKIAMNGYVPPFAFALLRIFFGTALLWLFHALTVKEKVTDRKDLWLMAKCGLFGVAMNQLLFLKGLSLTTAVNSSIIMTLIPIMVMVFSYFFLKEALGWRKVGGLLLALAGAILLLYKKEFGLSASTLQGDLFNFLNAASYAFYLILVKPLMQKYHPLTVIKWVFFFSCFIVFPFSITDLFTIQWSTFTGEVWGSLVYIIVFTTAVVYWLNVITLKYVSPSIVGVYIYLQPLFASLVAVLFFGELLLQKQIIAAVLIFSGVYFVSFSGKQKTKTEPQTS